MDMDQLINDIQREVQPYFGQGKVADYIPALARVSPNQFGMAVATVSGDMHIVGDALVPFSIQSISKVFTLALAMNLAGDEIWSRVGREPSGQAFNSLVQLEYEKGIPRNPFINAGALVVSDLVMGCLQERSEGAKTMLLDMVKDLCGNPQIQYDQEVARSEAETGHRNAALVHFLKSFGNIHQDPDQLLNFYYHHCSLAMSCKDLATSFLFLANSGVSPLSGRLLISPRQAKRINALMLTCGFYDAAGDFAYWVGLPGKSGVGGGIVAILPQKLAIAVWSPELDPTGNSVLGGAALERFTTKTGWSIF